MSGVVWIYRDWNGEESDAQVFDEKTCIELAQEDYICYCSETSEWDRDSEAEITLMKCKYDQYGDRTVIESKLHTVYYETQSNDDEYRTVGVL